LTDESNTFTNNNIQRNNEDGNNDDDDVIFVESRQSSTAPASENRRIFPPIATSSTLSGIMNRSLANVRARAQPEVFEHWFTRMAQEHGRGANFTTPQLNYQTPAWDMGYRSSNTDFPTFQSPPSTTLAPPQIVPPDPPAEGFTRNPAAGQVVVCPACGDELTQGATEDKQQVWVVKACGHVSYAVIFHCIVVLCTLIKLRLGILWAMYTEQIKEENTTKGQNSSYRSTDFSSRN